MSGQSERMDRAERGWVLALLGLALVLRMGFVLFQQPGFYFEDSLDYDRAARALLETGHFDARYYRFPFYSLFMAFSYKAFGEGLLPIRLIQAVLGTATCACVWMLGRRLFGVRTAMLALIGTAAFPLHIVLTGIEYSTALGTFLIWAVFTAVSGVPAGGSMRSVRLALGGVGVAFTILLFEGGLVLALFLLLWVPFGKNFRGFRVRSAGVLGIAALAVLAPWFYGMGRTGDYRPLILRAGIHLPTAPGVAPPLWEKSGGNLLMAKLSGMAGSPGWTIRHAWAEFVHFWSPYPDRLASADEKFREQLHDKDGHMVVENSLVGSLPRLLYAFGFGVLLLAAGVGALVVLDKIPRAGFLIAWPVVLGACYALFSPRCAIGFPRIRPSSFWEPMPWIWR